MNSVFKYKLVIFLFFIFPLNSLFSQDFSVLVNGGYSYRLVTLKDTISSSYVSYFNKKRPGFNYNLEAVWYSENQGLGVRFNSFLNSVSAKNIYLSPVERVDKNENIRIDYYSLQYHIRSQIKKSHFWKELCIGAGYVRYHSEGNELAEAITIIGKTFGLNATLYLDYQINKFLSVDISTNLFIAVLSNYLENGYTVNLNNKEGLTRIDANGGIKISF